MFRNFQLALLFLTEAQKGASSSYHPYILTLPRHFDSLVHWSDRELEELQYGSTEPEQQFLQEVSALLQHTVKASGYALHSAHPRDA